MYINVVYYIVTNYKLNTIGYVNVLSVLKRQRRARRHIWKRLTLCSVFVIFSNTYILMSRDIVAWKKYALYGRDKKYNNLTKR